MSLPASAAAAIAWQACPEELSATFPELDERLDCAVMRTPLNHHHRATSEWLELSVVRVRAADPDQRRGVLLVNPGGPGLGTQFFTTSLAADWEATTSPPSSKRRISTTHDLIGLQPRGLPSGSEMRCRSSALLYPYENITDDRSITNLQAINESAAVIGAGCGDHPWARWISTDQTARDMDLLREQLGEEKINYWGVSYGTELGAWYGALFPNRVDRMILDSNVNWTKDLHHASIAKAASRQEIFERFVVDRAITDPQRYRLGSTREDVHSRFFALHPVFRQQVRYAFAHVATLMAADVLQGWLRQEPTLGEADLRKRVENHRFSADPGLDTDARVSAGRAIDAWVDTAAPAAPLDLDAGTSVFNTVVCNSSMQQPQPAFWDALGDDQARRYPVGGSMDTHAPCAYWRLPTPTRPPTSTLGRLPHLMVLQMEFDAFTPRQPAFAAFSTIPSAAIVYARGLQGHGMIYNGISTCVDDAATAFMVDGVKPRGIRICNHKQAHTLPVLRQLQQLQRHERLERNAAGSTDGH